MTIHWTDRKITSTGTEFIEFELGRWTRSLNYLCWFRRTYKTYYLCTKTKPIKSKHINLQNISRYKTYQDTKHIRNKTYQSTKHVKVQNISNTKHTKVQNISNTKYIKHKHNNVQNILKYKTWEGILTCFYFHSLDGTMLWDFLLKFPDFVIQNSKSQNFLNLNTTLEMYNFYLVKNNFISIS